MCGVLGSAATSPSPPDLGEMLFASTPRLTACPPVPLRAAGRVRRVAMAAVPAGIYLAVQAGVVGVLWGFSVLHHHQLDWHPWDGDWYLEIAKHGYLGVDPQAQDAYGHHTLFTPMAFFPGYPVILAVVAKGLGGHYVTSGVLVSVAAGVAAATGMARLVEMVTRSRRTALAAVVLFAGAPMSIVYALVYPEALLVAASVWALVCVVQRRWWFAGPLAALAGWVSPMGVPVVAVVSLAAVVDLWRYGARWSAAVSAMLAWAGLAGYLLWVGRTTGVLLGYFQVQRAGWGSTFDFGVDTARWSWRTLTGDTTGFTTLTVWITIAAVALLMAVARVVRPWPLVAYSVLVVAMVVLTGGIEWDKARLLTAGFTLLIPVATWVTNRDRWATVGVLLVLVGFGVWFSAASLTVWAHSI